MQMLFDRERANQLRAGRRLEYFTLGWNLTEAAVAVGAGLFAGSIALVGFGVDSVIEVSSGLVLVWQLHSDRDADQAREHRLGLALITRLSVRPTFSDPPGLAPASG